MGTLDRVAALLAKAERTDNEAEADAYLEAAQRIATFGSVDLAVARAHISKRERREQPIQRTVHVGEPRQQANTHMVRLFLGIAAANDVQADIAANSTYVVAYGLPSDLDVVEAMFASLATQMVGAANEYVSAGQWRGTTYQTVVDTGWGIERIEERPHTARTVRTAFYKAFAARIRVRLADIRDDAVRERENVDAAAAASPGASAAEPDQAARDATETALVLKSKADEVSAFRAKTSKARGTWSGYRGQVRAGGAATRAGRSAADAARLSEQRGIGGSPDALPSG